MVAPAAPPLPPAFSSPGELLCRLQGSGLFKAWKKEHPTGFASHCFCPLTIQEVIGPWEIGWYNPQDKKITVFVSEGKDFWEKPAEEVFKSPQGEVEELRLEEIKVPFEKAQQSCQQIISQEFSHETPGSGFVILQHWENTPIWNFTFLCQSLVFLNLKIHAGTGAIYDKQAIQVVQKE